MRAAVHAHHEHMTFMHIPNLPHGISRNFSHLLLRPDRILHNISARCHMLQPVGMPQTGQTVSVRCARMIWAILEQGWKHDFGAICNEQRALSLAYLEKLGTMFLEADRANRGC